MFPTSPTRPLAMAMAALLVLTSMGAYASGSAEPDTTALAQDMESTGAVNLDSFLDGALAEDVTTEDCTLSGGAETTCYRITVAGYPSRR